eukprot:gnl/TRDRNA2_/TRDRNA2_165126_c0_seq1.p1 gnl/TRDRNA2_/TRDRNA2_165126_c0~~gnl/TRDRNA2_/TRDRNA2_165126_c0_seq1.p1  ORF type:complete len:433 (+),score=20.44 gnl/TRDRNA2_/TRDRNA2_165126_c0_seq1:168-1466(+)
MGATAQSHGSTPSTPSAAGNERLSFLQQVAAFSMTLSPGCLYASYFALIGFYVHRFDSKSISIAMIFCLNVPGVLVSLLQTYLDAYFDEAFSTRATYVFRVVVMQLMLGVVAIIWMLVPPSPWFILGIGLLIGFVTACVKSSANQMVAAMDPRALAPAQLGLLLGAMISVGALFVLDFRPTSSVATFQLAVLVVPITCVLCTGWLAYLHFRLNLFDRSFDRLAYDLPTSGMNTPRQFSRGGSPEDDEEKPLLPTENGEIPKWVWWWCAATFYLMTSWTTLTSIGAYFGNAAMTQVLFLSKLVMHTIGGLCAMPVHFVPCYKHGAWHNLLVFCTVIVTFIVLMACLKLTVGVSIDRPGFLIMWGTAHFLYAFLLPLIAMTTGLYVEVIDRKAVARINTAALFGGTVAGVIVATVLVWQQLDFETRWVTSSLVR